MSSDYLVLKHCNSKLEISQLHHGAWFFPVTWLSPQYSDARPLCKFNSKTVSFFNSYSLKFKEKSTIEYI